MPNSRSGHKKKSGGHIMKAGMNNEPQGIIFCSCGQAELWERKSVASLVSPCLWSGGESVCFLFFVVDFKYCVSGENVQVFISACVFRL
jgi:hypothetical protein